MRKLAFPKSVEGISDEKVKSDFSNSYSAEDKVVEKLLGDVAQNCRKKTRYRKDKKGYQKLKS
jgi:hypothetical protein